MQETNRIKEKSEKNRETKKGKTTKIDKAGETGKKRDLRLQKTYDSLIQSFQELIVIKPFDSITVRELCEKARVRPATFYTHFSDKYDFFAFMIQEWHAQFAAEAAVNYSPEDPADYYISLLNAGFTFMEENQKLIRAISNNALLSGMVTSLSEGMTEEIEDHIRRDIEAGHTFGVDAKLMTQILIGALNRVGSWWFHNQKEIDREKLFADLSYLIHKLYNIL